MGRAFRIRDFRLLFTGESISVLGDQFHFVALAWLTLQLRLGARARNAHPAVSRPGAAPIGAVIPGA